MKKVTLTSKVRFGPEGNTGKPDYLLLHMVLIVVGFDSTVIESATERQKNGSIFKMFCFAYIYSKILHLCLELYIFVNTCFIHIGKNLLGSAIS